MAAITVTGAPGATQVFQQPASGTPGNAVPYIKPFGGIYFSDPFPISATIQLLDAAGNPTDNDGQLTAANGVQSFNHTPGSGTYTFAIPSYYDLPYYIQQLEFVSTPVASANRPDSFVLTLTDTAGNSAALQTTIVTEPPATAQVAPSVAGTSTTPLNVVAPNAINPFKGVAITDGNSNPKDAVTITLSGTGVGNNTLAANNSAPGLPALSQASNTVYRIAADTPANVSTVLDNLTFSSAFMAVGNTVDFKLDVTNVNNNQTAINADTHVTDVPQSSPMMPVSQVTQTTPGTIGTPVNNPNNPATPNGPHDVGLHGAHTDYIIALNPSTGDAQVQDTVPNRDGTQSPVGLHDVVFTDGVGRFDATGNAEEVARLYKAAFNRSADSPGLDGWTTQLDNHTIGLSQVAAGFIGSPEFNNTYGSLDNTGFVTRLYQNVLGRAPDAAGLQSWVNGLNAGGSRQGVLVGFSDSLENKNDTSTTIGDEDRGEAYRLYRAALHRTPDPAGLDFWTSRLDGGTSALGVAQGFVDSTEFKSIFTSADTTAFITQLYQNVLNRGPDPAGLQSWTSYLNGGASRASVLLGFSDSLENRTLTGPATHDNWVFLPKA